MRKMNRLAALLAVLVMSTTMASTAFADGSAAVEAPAATPGKITVQNTVKNATYTLYKIFDATTNGDSVSYTVPEKETSYTGIETIFETRTQGGKKYVVGLDKKNGKQNADLLAWLNAHGTEGVYVDTKTCTGPDVTFDGLEYGYYYIHSSLANANGLAMAVTLKSSDVMAQEKNVESGWGERGGKTIATKDGDVTFSIGETIPYKVTYEKAYNFYVVDDDDGTKKAHKIYNYVLEDTMPAAVTLDENSFVVTVNGTEVKKKQGGVNDKGYSFSKDAEDNKKFTLTIPWAPTDNAEIDDFYYHDAPAKIVVTYNGVLNSDVVTGSAENANNTNMASMYYNGSTKSGEDKKAPVYSGEINITKVDGATRQLDDTYTKKLKGATFVVKSGDKYLTYTDNPGTDDAFGTTTNINNAKKYVTNDEGVVVIRGLKKGTYELVEIQAPDGYNVLNETKPVTLTFDSSTAQGTLVVASVVENFKGIQLPSTGGMGTTVFAIVGLLVMAGAAVTLIVKKRA